MAADVPVYFDAGWDVPNDELLAALAKQTPGKRPAWGRITAVDRPDAAEFHVALNHPTVETDTKLLLFTMEPPPYADCGEWDKFRAWRAFPTPEYSRPQRWWLEQTYDELRDLDPPEKTADLSWITSDKGLHLNPLHRSVRTALIDQGIYKHGRKPLAALNSPTDGHILRMNLYRRIREETDDIVDLYGRGNFDYPGYRGEINDKYDALHAYRYSLAIENYEGPNYWSEKIGDALLAWCMPIYWGCTNLSEYLPEDSFVRIDIEANDVVERIREIITSDLREQNLDAIAEARRRILDEHQLWPVVERAVSGNTAFRRFD